MCIDIQGCLLVNKTIRTKFLFESGLFCFSSAHRFIFFPFSFYLSLSHFVSRENYCLPGNQVTVLTEIVACYIWNRGPGWQFAGIPWGLFALANIEQAAANFIFNQGWILKKQIPAEPDIGSCIFISTSQWVFLCWILWSCCLSLRGSRPVLEN